MRVPDLDWPADLFTDAAVADDVEATDSGLSLWPAMRDAWAGNARAVDRSSLAA